MYSLEVIGKSLRGNSTIREYLYQNKLSIYLVYFLANFTNIRPEVINFLSLITGVISALFYSFGQTFYPPAILLHEISYLLDASDGKLARLKNQVTPFGEKLDLYRDKIVHILSLVGLVLGTYQINSDSGIVVMGVIYFALLSVNNFLSFRLMQKILPVSNNRLPFISSQNLVGKITHIKLNGIRVIPIPTVAEWLFIVFVVGPIFNQVWLGLFIACICIIFSICFLLYKSIAIYD